MRGNNAGQGVEGDAGRRWSRSQGGRAHPRGALGPGKEGTRRPSGVKCPGQRGRPGTAPGR